MSDTQTMLLTASGKINDKRRAGSSICVESIITSSGRGAEPVAVVLHAHEYLLVEMNAAR
jgi:hypothetical protein